MENESLNAILDDFKSGNEQAFNKIHSRCHKFLMAKAYMLLQDVAEAEDVVQEVFVKLWEARATLKPDTKFDAYLYTLVTNSSLSVLRKQKVKKRKEENFTYGSAKWYETRPLEDAELGSEINAAILALPNTQRNYFSSKYLNGESHKEIADKHGTSVQVVKNAVSKSLEKLRNNLRNKFS